MTCIEREGPHHDKEGVTVGFAEHDLTERLTQTREQPKGVRYHGIDVTFCQVVKTNIRVRNVKVGKHLYEAKHDMIWLYFIVPVRPDKEHKAWSIHIGKHCMDNSQADRICALTK